MYPSRDRGHPSGLMAMGKQAVGCALWPGGLWPCGLMNTRKQAHGRTLSRVADTPMALMVTRKRREGCIARGKGLRPSGRIDSSERGEGAPLRGFARGMRPHRRADELEGSSDRRTGLRSCCASRSPSAAAPAAIVDSLAVVEREESDLRRPGVRVGLPEDDLRAVTAPLVVGDDDPVGRELLDVRGVGVHQRELARVAGGWVEEVEGDARHYPEKIIKGRNACGGERRHSCGMPPRRDPGDPAPVGR